jgi:prophage antirepressor-like protein
VRGDDGEPWFRASDVCGVLGFSNPWQALESHVDEDDLQKLEAIDSLGRTQQANFVNESGMYALIFGSTKPEAKAFKRWVTHEVLPSIRKSGYFAVDSDTNTAIKQYLLFLRANKASGLPLTVAVEQSRQAMRDNGINIDKILPMPTVAFSDSVKINAEKDAAARDRIFSIIQSKGSVPQGTLFNRCRSMNKADFQKHIDVLLVQNKIQQVVLEHPATKKRFNCYRMSGALN